MNINEKINIKFRNKKSGVLENCEPVKSEGNIVNLASADLFYPERPLPRSVQDAILEQIDQPYAAHYQECLGNRELREMIAQRLFEHYGKKVDPGRHVLITPGSEVGLLSAVMLFTEPGDQILIPDPSYSTNFQYVELAGGEAVSIPLEENDGYQLDIAKFEKLLNEKTKAVILTYPNNPTGTVYDRKTMTQLCDFIIQNDLILICDMAFEDYIYDNVEFVWPAVYPEMWERTVTVFTASKGFGLCGLRVGYMVADALILDSLLAEAVPLLCSTNSLAQYGVLAAMKDKELLNGYKERLEKRREYTCMLLSEVPNISVVWPQGGIQCWVNVSGLGSSEEITAYLKREAGVAVSSGNSFGPATGEGHIRIVFGSEDDDKLYHDAIRRVCRALAEHPSNRKQNK